MHQRKRTMLWIIAAVFVVVAIVLVAVTVNLSNGDVSIEASSETSALMTEEDSSEAPNEFEGLESQDETDKVKNDKEDKKESSSTQNPKEEISETESQKNKQDKSEKEPEESEAPEEPENTEPIGPVPAPVPVFPTPTPKPTETESPTPEPTPEPTPTATAAPTPEPTVTPHEHDYVIVTIIYETNEDGTHIMIVTYSCNVCSDSYEDTKQEECIYGEWVFDGKDTDFAECELCGYLITRKHQQPESSPTPDVSPTPEPTPDPTPPPKPTLPPKPTSTPRPVIPPPVHNHNYVLVDITYESYQDGTHMLSARYSCTGCGSSYPDKRQEECTYSVEYIGNNQENVTCKLCGYFEIREHQHEEPENLEYVLDSSNSDGTHRYVSSYTCIVCTQVVTVYKNEDCDYGESSWRQSDTNDMHEVFKTCKICMYEHVELVDCTPTGEYKYITIGNYVYNYRDCSVCGDRCDRSEHTHKIYQWIPLGSDEHIAECICTKTLARERHDYVYSDTGGMQDVTCRGCGYGEPIKAHEHGVGLYDDMDLFDLVTSPTYSLDKTSPAQSYNPVPSETDWCYKYNFICHTCKMPYSVRFNSHNFVDDECTKCHAVVATSVDEEAILEDETLEPKALENESTEPEETEPTETMPDEIEPEGTAPEVPAPGEVPGDETQPGTIAPDETTPDEVPPEETPPEDVPDDIPDEEVSEAPSPEGENGTDIPEVIEPSEEAPEEQLPEQTEIEQEPEVEETEANKAEVENVENQSQVAEDTTSEVVVVVLMPDSVPKQS